MQEARGFYRFIHSFRIGKRLKPEMQQNMQIGMYVCTRDDLIAHESWMRRDSSAEIFFSTNIRSSFPPSLASRDIFLLAPEISFSTDIRSFFLSPSCFLLQHLETSSSLRNILCFKRVDAGSKRILSIYTFLWDWKKAEARICMRDDLIAHGSSS